MGQIINNPILDPAGGQILQNIPAGVVQLGPGGRIGGIPPINPERLLVRYWERYPRSFRGDNRDNGSSLEREYIVAWEAEFTAVKDLLGYPIFARKNGGRYLARYLPDSIWWWTTDEGGFEPARPFMWCTSVRHEGADVPDDKVCISLQTGQPRFKNVFLTATYETLTYKIRSDQDLVDAGAVDSFGNPDESFLKRYVTIKPNPMTRLQSLPEGSFALAINGGRVKGTPGRLEIQGDYSITWQRVPTGAVGTRLINPYMAVNVAGSPYIPPIEDCLGSVNLTPFAGQKKGTMLLTAAVLNRVTSAIGMELWDVEYRWAWLPTRSLDQLTVGATTDYQYGHNLMLYRNEPGGIPLGYYEIVSRDPAAGGSNYLASPPLDNVNSYKYRDHTALFRMPQLAIDNP